MSGLLPENWMELRDKMLRSETDTSEIRISGEGPEQVWVVDGHRHTREGGGDDIGTVAYDEDDARERLVKVIQQEHHDCGCETCEGARRGVKPTNVKRVR